MPEAQDRPEIDLTDGRFFAGDKHAAFDWMRANEPLYRDTNGIWAVTLHEDVLDVSRRPRIFCSRHGFQPDAPPMPMMINMDRPQHLVRRNLVNRGFTPRRVAGMEPGIRRVCTEILDAVCERGECDFVRDVAAPLPLIVIGDMLGVAPEDRDDLLRWSDVMVSATGSPDPSILQKARQALLEYGEYNRKVVADRRSRGPEDDLVSILVHAEIDGERLDDDSILDESLLILIGGDETTRHALSGGSYELIQNPEAHRRLIENPGAIPTAVEEMLRWVTPIQNMMRTATEDTVLRGQEVTEGDRLLLMYASANRDERVFERNHVFDIARSPNPHLAFGFGNHFCLGNNLARLELRVMLEELGRRMPDLAYAGEAPPPTHEANFIVGYETMPVRFSPSRPEAA